MASELRRSWLNAAHHACGARMVPFAGWEMPLHYGSQVDEHHAVRRGAGMFDVSHMLVLDLAGPRAEPFLVRVLSNDVARLAAPGQAIYSCLLNDVGGVIDDVIAYRLADALRLVLNAGAEARDLEWLAQRRDALAPRLELSQRRDLAILAVQGPEAREAVWRALPGARQATADLAPFRAAQCGSVFVARTGYTGEDGFELMLPGAEAAALWQSLLHHGVRPAGLGARDTLRLEAGMALSGQDMDETVTPAECGLGATVAFTPGRDFAGRAALEGRAPRWQSLGLVLAAGGVLRHGQRVLCDAGEGVVTSGGFAPTLERSVALARLPTALRPGAMAQVEVRGRLLEVRVVKPPFARHGRALV